MWPMIRGEVWWVRFGPSKGGEIRKHRPAIIMSNDTSNRFINRLQVVPLTSNVTRIYPGESYVDLNGTQYKELANQLTTVSKSRLTNVVGRLSSADLQMTEKAITVQLGLPRRGHSVDVQRLCQGNGPAIMSVVAVSSQ